MVTTGQVKPQCWGIELSIKTKKTIFIEEDSEEEDDDTEDIHLNIEDDRMPVFQNIFEILKSPFVEVESWIVV